MAHRREYATHKTACKGTCLPLKFQFKKDVKKIFKHSRNCELIIYAIKSLSVA